MTNSQSIKLFFDSVIKELKADQVRKNIKSSEASADSLKSNSNTDGGKLTGADYFQQQVTGRRPGKFPPIEDILQWIKTKGIQADIKPESLAFLIARKIARLGTDIHQGSRPGLDYEQIVSSNRQILLRNLAKGTATELAEQIKTAFRK